MQSIPVDGFSTSLTALPKRNGLRLSVAARNFGTVPVLDALAAVARAGFETCDNFPWRDEAEFATYAEGLRLFGLGAGVRLSGLRDRLAPGAKQAIRRRPGHQQAS